MFLIVLLSGVSRCYLLLKPVFRLQTKDEPVWWPGAKYSQPPPPPPPPRLVQIGCKFVAGRYERKVRLQLYTLLHCRKICRHGKEVYTVLGGKEGEVWGRRGEEGGKGGPSCYPLSNSVCSCTYPAPLNGALFLFLKIIYILASGIYCICTSSSYMDEKIIQV